MSDFTTPSDSLELLRQMWEKAGLPLPGMVAPTLDADDLDRRIRDLRSVEHWLKMNLEMLQTTVQTLEIQRSTLAALKAMGHDTTPPDVAAPPNPFAMWPWNLAQAPGGTPAEEGKPPSGTPANKDEKS